MLKKECCIKCWNAYGDSRYTDFDRKHLRWTELNEKYWNEERFYCPSEYLEKGNASPIKPTLL